MICYLASFVGERDFFSSKKRTHIASLQLWAEFLFALRCKLMYVVVGEDGRARFESDYVMDLYPKDLDACYLDGSLALVDPKTFGVGHFMSRSANQGQW